MSKVLEEIAAERARQDAKWGEQNHPNGTGDPGYALMANECRREVDVSLRNGTATWLGIFSEECFEAFAEADPAKLRKELVQTAAVAVAWIEAIDRAESKK